MNIRLALTMFLLTGCVIEDADNVTPKAGDGILVGDDRSIALDKSKVLTPPMSCENGQLLSRTANGWTCVPAPQMLNVNTLATSDLMSCAEGQVAKRMGTAWVCADDIDTDEDSLADTACAQNQILKWDGSGWICGDDATGGTGQSLGSLACTDGQLPRFDDTQPAGNKWVCAADLSAGTTLDGQPISTGAHFSAANAVAAVQNADITLGAQSTIDGAAITSAADLAAHAADASAHGESLASISGGCSAGQVPTFNASMWSCADPTGGPWTVQGADVYLNSGTEVGVGTTAPSTALDVVGGFTVNKTGTPTGLNQSVPDSESLHVFVGDRATFVSEQDETSGNFGGFDFIMDADGSLVPRLSVRTKTGGTVNGPLFFVSGLGGVGIGTDQPNRLLSVNGGASKVGGSSWDTFSDARLKRVDGNYDEGLDAVMKLRPVRYHYKADNALSIEHEEEHVGFVAQEVEEVLPDAVHLGPSGYLLVNNDPIILAMLNAIQEQQATIERQQDENEHLQARLARLEATVAKLAQSR